MDRATIRTVVFLCAAVLTGCDDGGGASPRVYFRMSEFGGCWSASTFVRLDGAEPARRDDGSIDCEIDAALAAEGCRFHVEEVELGDGGNWLSAKVEDCGQTLRPSLFSCVFAELDLSSVNEDGGTVCRCGLHPDSCVTSTICDLCASGRPGGGGCEDCANGKDDDGNGAIDCEDPHCDLTEACGVSRTTITCTTSSTLPPVE